MRTVSPEEAKACKERMHLWAKSDNRPSGGSLGEWVYKPIKGQKPLTESSRRVSDLKMIEKPNQEEELITVYEEKLKASGMVMAETPGAAQRKWSTRSEFPCCPKSTEENQISAYAEKLMPGVIFARNCYSTSMVLESALADDNQSIWVISQKAEADAIKPWSLAKVTYENDLYVHTSCGTFFMKDGAEKKFFLARGLEWTGG